MSLDLLCRLRTEGLWLPNTPLNIALFSGNLAIPNFISIDSFLGINDHSSIPTPYSFPPYVLDELFIAHNFSSLSPAAAIRFLADAIGWVKPGGRVLVRCSRGDWRFNPQLPGSQPTSWSMDALYAVFDHIGVIIDYMNNEVQPSPPHLAISGIHHATTPEPRRLQDYVERLVEGSLCGLGYVAPQDVDGFISECLGSPDLNPPRPTKIRTPQPNRSTPDQTHLQILHTVEFYAPHTGGAELVVQKLSEKLAERGHGVAVATRKIPERTFDQLNGVDIYDFDVDGRSAKGITGLDQLRYMRFLQEYPCDVMMNYAAQQWATDLALPLISRLKRRVNIIAPCGYSALKGISKARDVAYHNYFSAILPQTLPRYDAAIYHSAFYQDYEFGTSIGLNNQVVIPNAVDEAEFQSAPAVNFREKYNIRAPFMLLCVANFFAGKGQERLIQVLRDIKRQDMSLVLIGGAGDTLAQLQIQASGLPVHFLTDVPRIDTIAAFFCADLFVFASDVEASPLVIIEAKAAGLPFLSTDVGNVREWKGGLVCPYEQMPAKIESLLSDPVLRSELGREGRKEYLEKLTWTAVTNQYEELYLRLAREKR